MFSKRVSLIALLLIVFASVTAHADFIQVSTSFGTQTALRDNTTQLDWLHLNVTDGYSYDAMQVNLLAGGLFDGWRYATPQELSQFFRNYDGSADGVVRYNDALTLQFLTDLGGPTYTADNASTGFHREAATAMLDVPFELGHAIYGYIALDNLNGATIDPNLQGSTVDWYANPNSAHWLVRQSSVPQVPEPASIALLANGLLVTFLIVQRKKGK